MKKLSLIVPIYNEEATLLNTVNKIIELEKEDYFKKNLIEIEVILVDDCSNDKSKEIAEKISDNNKIKFFTHKKNKGKGAALKTGFIQATGDYIGIQDADNEYNPKDYIKLLKPLLENKADVCFGSRYLKQNTRRVLYFWHTCMNKFLTLLTNMYTNLDITDMETCYKLFKKEVIKEIIPKLKENRFGFEPEVTIQIAKGNWQVYETAISYTPRTYEEGKKIKAKDGLRAMYCIFHYGANTAPIPMQFILYLFIGAISAIANIISFMILTTIFNNLILNISIAFFISAFVNYILCILILFRHKARWNSVMEIITYIVTLIIMGTIDYYTTLGLLIIGCGNFWSKTISSGVGVFGNFILRKYFVFPEKQK